MDRRAGRPGGPPRRPLSCPARSSCYSSIRLRKAGGLTVYREIQRPVLSQQRGLAAIYVPKVPVRVQRLTRWLSKTTNAATMR